jgi:hypothetical protein
LVAVGGAEQGIWVEVTSLGVHDDSMFYVVRFITLPHDLFAYDWE